MTVHDLIKSALRLIGGLDTSEPPSADMSADGLEALNLIIDDWSSKGLLIYAVTPESFTLTGATSYTIGSGGTFNTTRPESISGAYVTDGGIDYPVDIIGPEQYRSISLKTAPGISDWLYYSPEYPLGKIYIYLISSGTTLTIDSIKPLTEYASLITTLSLPPGYKRALKFNLAVDLIPEYGRQIDPAIYQQAEDAKTSIISKNAASRVDVAKLDFYDNSYRWTIDGG